MKPRANGIEAPPDGQYEKPPGVDQNRSDGNCHICHNGGATIFLHLRLYCQGYIGKLDNVVM